MAKARGQALGQLDAGTAAAAGGEAAATTPHRPAVPRPSPCSHRTTHLLSQLGQLALQLLLLLELLAHNLLLGLMHWWVDGAGGAG